MQSNRAPRGIGVPPSIYNGYSTGWQYFLSSTTWKHPNPGYPLTLIVLAIGGGGGGGNTGTAANGCGGGGGSGRVSFTEQTNITTDQAIVIGTAGTGGAAGAAANTGASGGTTTFGSLISLAGGSGGVGCNSDTGAAGGSGGFGGGGGFGRADAASTGGDGGAGLDYIGGGGGAAGYSAGYGTNGTPGVSAASAHFAPFATSLNQGATGTAICIGGWPNGGSLKHNTSSAGVAAAPTGGDATLLFPLLMGLGAGGPGVKAAGAGKDGKAGAVIIMIRPF